MRQQINLYHDLPQISRYRVSKKLFEQLCWGLKIFILTITIIQFVYLRHITYQCRQLEHKITMQDPFLIQQHLQKVALEQALANKKAQLQALPPMVIPPCYFSDYLASLAQAKVLGVWLSTIDISIAKSSVVLAGKVASPILMSQWLQQLAQTSCFRQQKFSALTLNSAQQITSFTLSSVDKP